MTTTDVQLPATEDWTTLTPVSSNMIIYNGTTTDCVLRFGVSSTSNGMVFPAGHTILVDEPVYVKLVQPYKTYSGSLRVST